jgi:hypothetical protein
MIPELSEEEMRIALFGGVEPGAPMELLPMQKSRSDMVIST